MKRFFLIINVLISYCLYSQPTIAWQKSFGGIGFEEATDILQTSDGGYITVGWTASNNGDVTDFHGVYDCWAIKMNSSGGIEWQKALGGYSEESGVSLLQTTDGGYIIAGRTFSIDKYVIGNHGSYDFWIVKLNSTGTIDWQKCYGGTGQDEAFSIDNTLDGNYIITGYSDSNNGDVSGNHGSFDYWVIKISSNGNLLWQKSLGGSASDYPYAVKHTSDGGYIVTGLTYSTDGDVSGNHGYVDCWTVKLDGYGNIQWQKCLGGTKSDAGYAIEQTSDGGYIIAANSNSNNGNVSGNHGGYDFWAISLDPSGTVSWQACLGGTGDEYAGLNGIKQVNGGGFVAAVTSSSNNGNVTGNHGGYDFWIVKFLRGGEIEWQQSYGGTGEDRPSAVKATSDGGYIVAGRSKSNNGDVTGNHGDVDYWVVKLSNTLGLPDSDSNHSLFVYPNPAKNQIQIRLQNSTENMVGILVYDILGNCVKEEKLSSNSTTLDISDLSKGVYLMETTTESQVKLTQKLLIE